MARVTSVSPTSPGARRVSNVEPLHLVAASNRDLRICAISRDSKYWRVSSFNRQNLMISSLCSLSGKTPFKMSASDLLAHSSALRYPSAALSGKRSESSDCTRSLVSLGKSP